MPNRSAGRWWVSPAGSLTALRRSRCGRSSSTCMSKRSTIRASRRGRSELGSTMSRVPGRKIAEEGIARALNGEWRWLGWIGGPRRGGPPRRGPPTHPSAVAALLTTPRGRAEVRRRQTEVDHSLRLPMRKVLCAVAPASQSQGAGTGAVVAFTGRIQSFGRNAW